MKINEMDDMIQAEQEREDTVDVPDCFGEYARKNKLCNTYCAVAMRCCIVKGQTPKVDVLERLLTQNQYAVKLN